MKEYVIKPKVRNMAYANIRKQREEREAEKKAEQVRKSAEKKQEKAQESENKSKMHKEVVFAIDNNTESLKQALTSLKDRVEKIDIEIPEYDTSPIVEAINKVTANLDNSLKGINKQISAIKLDVPEVDFSDYSRSIESSMRLNTNTLKTVLEGVEDRIAEIRLEEKEPITVWEFHIRRDKNHDIEYIDAKANG